MNHGLNPEDYEEPTCPFCTDLFTGENHAEHIDVGRVIRKLDELLNRNDFPAAVRHLEYWLREAQAAGDTRGELSVQNELMGIHRKCGNREEAYRAAARALALVKELGLEDSVTCATTSLNAATVYKAFGEAKAALPLYETARRLYEKFLSPSDARLGGLYNNLALALTDTGDYSGARACLQKAIGVMSRTENGEPEEAVSYLNLADTARAEKGMPAAEEEIDGYLAEAERLLNSPSVPQNGAFAFVCEKCASAFEYYGYFLFARELKERAGRIYEGA